MVVVAERPTGVLKVERIRGRTVVTTAYARYPLKFISATRAADRDCAWVYALGYGGGAVRGDQVTIFCTVGEECAAALTTQGSTKVYKRGTQGAAEDESLEGKPTQQVSQSLLCRVLKDGIMAIVPDPVTCFGDACFKQHQQFQLSRGSSLILVDWLTSGRMSRGEGWNFHYLESRNEVMVETQGITDIPTAAQRVLHQAEKVRLSVLVEAFPLIYEAPAMPGSTRRWEPLVLDSLVLEDIPGLSIRERMLDMNVVGLVILLGPRVVDVVSTLLEQEAKKRARMPAGLEAGEGSRGRPSKGASGSTENRRERKAGARHEGRVISTISRLRGGCEGWCHGLVYKFAAEQTEDARKVLHNLLLPLRGSLGGRAPYA